MSTDILRVRPGARFYVTVRSGNRTGFLAGPYASHMCALSAVEVVRRKVRDAVAAGQVRAADVMDAEFGAYGTVSYPRTVRTVFGRVSYRPPHRPD